jgi:hypothetical protein
VCDFDTHAFHVLSGQGDILTCKVMEDTGIKYPYSLDIDMRGQLWVGCVEDEGSDAKIHGKTSLVNYVLFLFGHLTFFLFKWGCVEFNNLDSRHVSFLNGIYVI